METSLVSVPIISLIACQLCRLAYVDINFYANVEYVCPDEESTVVRVYNIDDVHIICRHNYLHKYCKKCFRMNFDFCK